MSIVHRLIAGLKFSREFTRQVLDEFQTEEDWLSRPHDRANHAMWFAGHMGLVDNSTIGMLAPSQLVRRTGFKELFGMGSTPSDDPADYPSPAEIREWMDDRRAVLLEHAERLTDEDLSRPTPQGAPPFLKDLGQVLQFMAWHEGMHSGQITVPHRALGHAPIAFRPTKEAANV